MCLGRIESEHEDGDFVMSLGILWTQDANGEWQQSTLWYDTAEDAVTDDDENSLDISVEEADRRIAEGEAAYRAAMGK